MHPPFGHTHTHTFITRRHISQLSRTTCTATCHALQNIVREHLTHSSSPFRQWKRALSARLSPPVSGYTHTTHNIGFFFVAWRQRDEQSRWRRRLRRRRNTNTHTNTQTNSAQCTNCMFACVLWRASGKNCRRHPASRDINTTGGGQFQSIPMPSLPPQPPLPQPLSSAPPDNVLKHCFSSLTRVIERHAGRLQPPNTSKNQFYSIIVHIHGLRPQPLGPDYATALITCGGEWRDMNRGTIYGLYTGEDIELETYCIFKLHAENQIFNIFVNMFCQHLHPLPALTDWH